MGLKQAQTWKEADVKEAGYLTAHEASVLKSEEIWRLLVFTHADGGQKAWMGCSTANGDGHLAIWGKYANGLFLTMGCVWANGRLSQKIQAKLREGYSNAGRVSLHFVGLDINKLPANMQVELRVVAFSGASQAGATEASTELATAVAWSAAETDSQDRMPWQF